MNNPIQNFSTPQRTCKLCACSELKLWRKANLPDTLSHADFAITDNRYGLTFPLYRCRQCGFLQSFDGDHAINHYRNLVDTAYTAGYAYRSLQFESLLKLSLPELPAGGRLFDIGAADGMLLEQAERMGFSTEGIEPSEWLCARAWQRKCKVLCAAFPDPRCSGPYDVITAVDVLEHVADPLALLAAIRNALSPQGRAILVTPDVSSLAARLLRRRWWHFRIAHVSYFNRTTLLTALKTVGLTPIKFHRPGWVFSGQYLWQRLAGYFPILNKFQLPKSWERLLLPINFRDSWLLIVERKPSDVR